MNLKQRTTPENFWPKFNKEGPDFIHDTLGNIGPCWIWTGAIKANENGMRYGVTTVNYKFWHTHRLSYFYAHGSIPEGMQVCHHCDFGPCGNPAHLFADTCQGNANDKVKKNRQAQGERHALALAPNRIKGEKHFRAQMTNEMVIEMRRLYNIEKWPVSKIAAFFDRKRQAVGKIVYRLRWKHVP